MATAFAETYRRLMAGPNFYMAAALVAAAITLVSGAVLGARNTAEAKQERASAAAQKQALTDAEAGAEGPAADAGATPGAAGPGASTSTATVGAGARPGASGPAKKPPGVPEVSTPGATREGVFSDYFELGVHAPLTLSGAPLNLTEDPVTGFKGYITHINRNGGVNGRKVRVFLVDDKYSTAGGGEARDKLVKEIKPFFLSGTLGVDQIAIVSTAANQAKIPYFAAGGPEPEWRTRGMYQIGSNYDQNMDLLSKFICKHGREYVGDDVRLGTTTLDSEYILPVEKRFVAMLEQRCGLKVDQLARGTIKKPQDQTSYVSQALDLKRAYGDKGANLIVPLQDPVSTSRQVAEWKGQTYSPKWTFSNFVHDADTALTLMAGDWTGMRGLRGACVIGHPNAYNTSLCANLKAAHDEWVGLGNVTYDENAGGSTGSTTSSYNYNESSWGQDGPDGSSGYQLAHIWLGAMKSIGTDPTREKFLAAINAYDRYSDLVTGPITYRGSANIMRGAGMGVVVEGGADLKYRQIQTPGLVDQF
ncbi:MAG TPA: ABC transporter substrate-binding protein [Actinomycetota bacterium]|nr:ABC transporter substrate-binding protein [Actinomycetota bacterium]